MTITLSGASGLSGPSVTISDNSTTVATSNPILNSQTGILTTNYSVPCNATISGTQSVVVGQQIALTASQSLPMCMSLNTQTWTQPSAAGTPIGGFTASTASGSVTQIANVPTTGAGYTFYWTTPANSQTATYSYTMVDELGARVTSPIATATFNVSGLTGVEAFVCGGAFPAAGCSSNGQLGQVAIESSGGKSILTCGPGDTDCIIVTVSASATPPGTFSFAQFVNYANTTYYQTNGSICRNNLGPGLDTGYPYGISIKPATNNNAPTTTEDAPSSPIFSDDSEVTESFSARMYVMWTASNVASPIPVPVGYVDWGFSGDAVQDLATGIWSINSKTTSIATGGIFKPSSLYPYWDTVAVGGPPPCK